MKNVYLIGLIIIGLALSSCNKEDDSIRFFWNQTKCSDPWNTGENNSNEQTKKSLKLYLENSNINALRIDFDNNSPLDILCKSCGCGTGQRIIVEVMKKDEIVITNLNFYQ